MKHENGWFAHRSMLTLAPFEGRPKLVPGKLLMLRYSSDVLLAMQNSDHAHRSQARTEGS
jgi:hypothetical protein